MCTSRTRCGRRSRESAGRSAGDDGPRVFDTGQRPADVRKLRKSDVSGDYLLVGQNKTSRKLRIRLRRADGQMTQLGRLIESITSDSPALVTNEKGQPMTEKMLAPGSIPHVRLRPRRRSRR